MERESERARTERVRSTWEPGIVTYRGQVYRAWRDPETGTVVRDRGLFIIVLSAPVGSTTAKTFIPKSILNKTC